MLKTIKINSIWNGQAPSQYFGSDGMYNASLAIDPDLPIVSTGVRTSGMVVPVGYAKFSSTDVTGTVIREITHPKDNNLWTVQANGKINVYDAALTTETIIGTVTGSFATWAEYYNNYIYIFGTGTSKNDVSRVGPLNTLPYDAQSGNFTIGLTVTGGSSGATGIITADVDAGSTGTLTLSNITGLFTDNETITDTSTGSATVARTFASLITNGVWTGATLGSLTGLTNTKYPTLRAVPVPNHVAHVHGDGSMYFCDFINGQGLIHRINTKKVTNEGDTNGTTVASAYNVLDLPFGFYPTSIVSHSTSVLITGIYTVDTTTNQGKSAFVLWDPTDVTSFYLGPVYLPDPLCTATLSSNGTTYIWTGNAQNGVRLSRYLGGQTVEEIIYLEEGLPPVASGVDVLGNRIVWGGFSTNLGDTGCVWAWGSKDNRLPDGLHNVAIISTTASTQMVSSIKYVQQSSNVTPKLVIAWRTSSTFGIDKYSATATLSSQIRFMINIGEKFEVKKLSIPLMGAVAANTSIVPTLYFDDLSTNKALTTINNTNYSGKRKIVYHGAELKDTLGSNNMVLDFVQTSTNPLAIGLPITLEIDIKEDES